MEDCAEKRLQRGPAGGDQREAGPVLLAAGVGEGRAEAGVRQPRAVAGGGLAPAGALRHPPLAARAALAVAWEGEVVWKLWDGSWRVIGRLKLFDILDKRYWFQNIFTSGQSKTQQENRDFYQHVAMLVDDSEI